MTCKLTTAITLSVVFSAGPGLAQQAAAPAGLTPQLAAELSRNPDRPVIVLMRRHLQGALAAHDQSNVLDELSRVGARRVRSFRLVNALAASVSVGELARLRANPDIAAVVPDVVLRPAPHQGPARQAATAVPRRGRATIPGVCPSSDGVQLNPEALLVTGTAGTNPTQKSPWSLGFRGAGVRVAYIANAIDTMTPNLVRADGSSVFVDYEDFAGDGPIPVSGNTEATEDAAAIAGQGLIAYDISSFGPESAKNPSGSCKIRVAGVAPDVGLIGLVDQSQMYGNTVSSAIEAIDYAASVAHADVLNESFAGYNFPDVTSLDVLEQFNDAAVAAGVTVTVSSGDAGIVASVASPASDPLVIAMGASTTLRFQTQVNSDFDSVLGVTGWLDDNISALSSSGFTQSGRTLDLVAPGDTNWGTCTEMDGSALSCMNTFGAPTGVALIGGTSEAAPIAAGAAALVIQAYRSTHHGASPAPALVKQILTSAAVDLGAPAVEQGSGIVNSYNAVVIAESVATPDGTPVPAGPGILLSQNQLNAVGAPSSRQSWTMSVTNTAPTAQSIAIAGRSLSPPLNMQTGIATITAGTSPTFINAKGKTLAFATFKIHVHPGAARLYVADVPGQQLVLLDPHGRRAAESNQQGAANFAAADVRAPQPGIWTGVVSQNTSGLTSVAVQWQTYVQNFVPFATISPAALTLAPGQTRNIKVTATLPVTPGDSAGSIVFTASAAGKDPYAGPERSAVSVTLRSLIPLGDDGIFVGQFTGGDGRYGNPAEVSSFQFNVPAGTASITANMALTGNASDVVQGFLVAPDGTRRAFATNNNNTGLLGDPGGALALHALNPPPGLWTLVFALQNPVFPTSPAALFDGSIVLNQAAATAAALPANPGTVLAAGSTVVVPVTITNNGAAPNSFFIDARLNTQVSFTLALQNPTQGGSYPLPGGTAPWWMVPSETATIGVTAAATLPVMFTYRSPLGDPILYGTPASGNAASGMFAPSGDVVPSGPWIANPNEIGPFPNAAPQGSVNMTMTAMMKPFDPALTSPTGDYWQNAVTPGTGLAAILLAPGQSATVNVRITPTGAPGTVVSGTLYLDDLQNTPFGYPESSNEVAALPYAYTVGAPVAAAGAGN